MKSNKIGKSGSRSNVKPIMKKFKKGFVVSGRLREIVDNMDSCECASPYSLLGIEEEIRKVQMVSRMWWCLRLTQSFCCEE